MGQIEVYVVVAQSLKPGVKSNMKMQLEQCRQASIHYNTLLGIDLWSACHQAITRTNDESLPMGPRRHAAEILQGTYPSSEQEVYLKISDANVSRFVRY